MHAHIYSHTHTLREKHIGMHIRTRMGAMHIYIHTDRHWNTLKCIHVWSYAKTDISTQTHTRKHINRYVMHMDSHTHMAKAYIEKYAHVHIHPHIHTHVSVHTYNHIFTETNTYTSTHTRTYILTNPSVRVGYDTRSIFKRSLTGLKSEFSFF